VLEGFVSCVVTSEHRHANHRWGVDVVQLPVDLNTIRLVLHSATFDSPYRHRVEIRRPRSASSSSQGHRGPLSDPPHYPSKLDERTALGPKKMAEKESKSASVLEDAETIPSPSSQKLPESGTHERMLAERELLRKLDMRLLPTIFVIFIMNYIDVCTNFTSTVW